VDFAVDTTDRETDRPAESLIIL